MFNSFGINSNGFNKIENIKNKIGYKNKIILDRKLKTAEIINLQKSYLKQDYENFISQNNRIKILFIGDSHARDIYISAKLNQENAINYDLYKFTLGNNCLFYLRQKKSLRKKDK